MRATERGAGTGGCTILAAVAALGGLVAAPAMAAMSGQAGPVLPLPVIAQDEAALADLSYFSAAAIGELTGDGVADVLVTRRGPGGTGVGRLLVYTGDGAGGLTLGAQLDIAGDPTSVLLEDVTGDGRVDALVADGAASTLSIYAQRVAGRFELVETIATGRTPLDVVLADATGDGVKDLLVCNYDHYYVGLHAGLPGGGFAPQVRLNVDLRPADMAVIDVDGDGDLDVLTANELSGTVSLVRNLGGAFAPAVVAVEMRGATSLGLADLDGDGLPEMVVAGAEGVRLFHNDGGAFTSGSAVAVGTGSDVRHVRLQDVDADGHPDLVLAGSGAAEVLAGVPGGLADTSEPLLLVGGFAPRSGGVFAGRLTGADGLDLVLVEAARVSVALQAGMSPAGPAGLWTPVTIDTGDADAHVVGQFTDDALPDALILDSRGSRLLVGLGGGAFAEPASVRAMTAQNLVAARLRPGALDDVLVVNGTLLVLRPDGAGGFGPPVGVVGDARDIAVGDLDGDGDLDVALGGVHIARPIFNDGLGNLTPGGSLDLPGSLGNIAIGDLTGDGRADIVVAGWYSGVGTAQIYFWPGLGGGAFGPMRTFETRQHQGFRVRTIDVGDAGDAMLAIGSRVVLLVRHLDGPSPTVTTIVDGDERISECQVLDANGDGRQDFSLTRMRGGTRLWLQGTDGAFEQRDGFAWWASTAELVEATGDGHLDALLGLGNRTLLAIGRDGRLAGCPADLDGDGRLTLFDFLAFQTLFDAGDPRADFDGDGVLTVFDFLQYQNLFDLGCP